MEFPRELIKRKFQKNNSIPVFPFFIAIVSSQSVALLAYFAGILMLSQYGKEVGISMLFSAINEINIPHEPVGEPLSQFPWLTVQEYKEIEMRSSSGWIINLQPKEHVSLQDDHKNAPSEQLLHISHLIIGLRSSIQDWSCFGRHLTEKQH